ncbi:MAG: DUF5915 domain-containing protein, partial [Planctomycetales bacterium]
QFPADFISEAIDQTRGWFYSLLAISTMLFGDQATEDQATESKASPEEDRAPAELPHPFRNCIVLGLMLAETMLCPKCDKRFTAQEKKCPDCGVKLDRKVEKMAKRLKNYPEPATIFDKHGADALRWYFFANQAPWTSIIYSERAIRESVPEFLLRLWNVFNFFLIYARIDEFEPEKEIEGDADQMTPETLARAKGRRPVEQRGELDRWILSELHRATRDATEAMDAYDNFTACKRLHGFVDSLSNWYVRRGRPRFWSKKGEENVDKTDAYWTLYECLLTTSKLVAPFTPFVAEVMWRDLAKRPMGDRVSESVHLCDYPVADEQVIDEDLSRRMELVRQVSSLGRGARASVKDSAAKRVRQPLSKVEVILADPRDQQWLEDHSALIADELNVKCVEFTQDADQYINYNVLPDLKRLGPRIGKQVPQLRKALSEADPVKLIQSMEEQGKATLDLPDGPLELDREDLVIRLEAKPGWTAAQGPDAVVVLSTEITPELESEGYSCEVVHAIQNQRKELKCDYEDRIEVAVVTEDAGLAAAVVKFSEYIQGETLAVSLGSVPLDGVDSVDAKAAGVPFQLYVRVVNSRADD